MPHNEETKYDADASDWEKGRGREHRWFSNSRTSSSFSKTSFFVSSV